ncbi:hypothetical protein RA086_00460 [Lactiplantibacillus sp. WILCCON 0030]|uniref:Uncharacterized protein n=1 Tax=Lactiplantibacillus brownii TaxID=3069269 RepID=A0ABU1A5Z0_9LACO|nr:hypothetical protein [Lactiplantibacillus brownii]MDQ7936120.1 hypothetical protein [Lactiplantibacillus brownii]
MTKIMYLILMISSIAQVIVLINFLDAVFLRKKFPIIVYLSFVMTNVLIAFSSTIFFIRPLIAGIGTIAGWAGLSYLYKGSLKSKFLYILTFFVMSAILESISLYILGIGNANFISKLDRVRAFSITTILYVCALMIFKYVLRWGNSKMKFRSSWSIYLLPVFGLCFDSIVFYRKDIYTTSLQAVVIIGSLLLSLDAIFLVNKFDKKYFELQKYATLNKLFKMQQKKLRVLTKYEEALSIEVHKSDEMLLKLYSAINVNNNSLALDLIEERLLELNTNLVKVSNPQRQITKDLLIDHIYEICAKNKIDFINDTQLKHTLKKISIKDQVALISVIFSYALEEILNSTETNKYFKLKIHQKTEITFIFVSFSMNVTDKQINKARYIDFSRKSYALQYVDVMVKKHSGHIKLKLSKESFGMLITL